MKLYVATDKRTKKPLISDSSRENLLKRLQARGYKGDFHIDPFDENDENNATENRLIRASL